VRAQILSMSEKERVAEELGRVKALLEETGAAIYRPLAQDLEDRLTSPGSTQRIQIGGSPAVNGQVNGHVR
jgi:hypothetical protein